MPMLEREGHGEAGGSSRGSKKGKGKQVARSETPLDKFISVQAAANYEDWTQKKRKIAPGHRVDLSDMGGMEIIPALFHDIGWGYLLIVNELFYPMMLYEFYSNQQRGCAFTQKNKKCFDPSLYNEKRFEEIFTKRIMLKRSEDRTIDKHDAYGRILHHIISNIVIPNVGDKSYITNMHSFVMLAMHEHRKINFGYIAMEHMLATQSSSTKCCPTVVFLPRCSNIFKITYFGPNDHIGIGKIYNQNTFKRMGFSRNEDRRLIRGGQEEDSENCKEEEEDEGNEPENMMKMKQIGDSKGNEVKEETRKDGRRFIFG
ncbi:hypothetical protein M9H77_11736 [Catharanthus roseus]|uniref:Uncharacterized protein n=1 Tax=Catharanthus roseus TaxID=4058 RepID=A0ACC0BFH3_CATRO|nr:hypothetical protein M9H77_11736 [Catharanthus roseus]